MYSTKKAFDAFDTALNLDPRERLNAQKRHAEITACLIAESVAASTFLQGSFARKTMPKPLKDVDMVVMIHPGLGSLQHEAGGSTRAMIYLRNAVAKEFPQAQFDVGKKPAHALQITFPELPFTFDLVPAFPDPDSEDVFIADREQDRWERSNTRTLNRLISARNSQAVTGGRFVHQVRMLKAFKKNHPGLGDTCGLLWEAFSYTRITSAMDHSEALAAVLSHAAIAVWNPVLDPTGIDDLTGEWTPGQRSDYARSLTAASRTAQEAKRLEQDGEHVAAIDLWHTLLQAPFPNAPDQSAADALAALASGSITSTGRAVVSQRAHQPARPTRSWRTH